MIIAVGLMIIGVLVVYLVSRRRQVIYDDASQISAPVLYDDEWGLSGKPDYLEQSPDGQVIPVEVKSRRAPKRPFPNHKLQLGVYFRLVEVNYDIRPAFGFIEYRDRRLKVQNTRKLRAKVRTRQKTFHRVQQGKTQPTGNPSPGKCRHCIVQAICPESVV